jgi:hypothetical protein
MGVLLVLLAVHMPGGPTGDDLLAVVDSGQPAADSDSTAEYPNVTLSLLQLTRTGNASYDERRAHEISAAEAAAGDVDLIVFPGGFLRGDCDRRFNWFVALSRTTTSAIFVTCEEPGGGSGRRSKVALLQSRGDSPWLIQLTVETGAAAAINQSLLSPRASSAVVTTTDGRRGKQPALPVCQCEQSMALTGLAP